MVDEVIEHKFLYTITSMFAGILIAKLLMPSELEKANTWEEVKIAFKPIQVKEKKTIR